MVSRIWTSLNRIEPEEQTYIKRVLYVVGITGLLATAITTATTIPSGYTNLILASAISLGIVAAMLWLTWRNHLSLPRIVFPLLGLIVATYIIRNSDGIRDETMYIFPLTLILAGLLLGKYGVLIFTLLDFAAISIQALGEINGQITDRFSQYTTFESLVVIGVLLAFAGTLLYVTISNLRQNLIHAHVNEKKFADSNRELQGIRNSLEERVNVRTAQLQASAEVGRSAASTLDPE
ncbi:MAG TPA: hypothetical protein VFK30_11185, partial [Anaerolineae bacterium]|nr:hypothetical protein [Anaerolineae bacterium]